MNTRKNPWVGYSDRDFETIKASVKNRLKVVTPEMFDLQDSNIFMMLVDIFSGLHETLNGYIDNTAQEMFVSTARRYSSMFKLARLLNYRVRASIPSSVILEFAIVDGNGDPVIAASTHTNIIPIGTIVTSDTGLQFITTSAGTILSGTSSIAVNAKQQVFSGSVTLGISSGLTNQAFELPTNYADSTITVTINVQNWAIVKDFALSESTDKVAKVEVREDGKTYLVFGDGVNGAIPTGGLSIGASYYTTSGTEGNLDTDTITTVVSTLTIPVQVPAIAEITVNNNERASGGLNTEDIERLRRAIPLSVRTLDRAVTRQDYIDVAKLAPGVDKAALFFECGKFVEIYIAPIGGGVATSQLLSDTGTYMDARKIITTFITMKPAGETFIGLSIEATGNFLVKKAEMQTAIQEALLENYNSSTSDINKYVRRSDIIALIDNLPQIEHLDLTLIYSVPYARPSNPAAPLDWLRTTLSSSTSIVAWKLVYDSALFSGDGGFRLYKENVYIMEIAENVQYNNVGGSNILSLKIITIPSNAINDDNWEFKTYPYNEDLLIDDFTVPIISLDYVTLTLNEQLA